MKVLIRMLHGAQRIGECLRRDGWTLETQTPDRLTACHPEVTSEPDARLRLHDLGLLISRALRIEFPIATIDWAAKNKRHCN